MENYDEYYEAFLEMAKNDKLSLKEIEELRKDSLLFNEKPCPVCKTKGCNKHKSNANPYIYEM
jgi:hypothetical protein